MFTAGGTFPNTGAALAFLGAVAGAGFSTEARCRRRPDSQVWWADTDGPPEHVVQFVWTAGGKPYVGQGTRWTPVPPSGTVPARKPRSPAALDLAHWPPVDLAGLLADFPLRPARYLPSATVLVVAPGALSRWILRRASFLELDVRLSVASGALLGQRATKFDLMVHHLSAPRGAVPHSLVHALSRLPYTTVATSLDPETDRLWVDAYHRTPLEHTLLASLIPEGETWVFGAPDVGHRVLRIAGKAVTGANLLDLPALPQVTSPGDFGPARLPEPLPVRLVPQPGGRDQVDAVLLDDLELNWVRAFLIGRPIGEQSFLLPGHRRHLLLAPGGLPSALPFGLPLFQVRPGGLYLELGMAFSPPLPEDARAKAFQTGEDRVVVVTAEGAFRFELDRLVPAWALWVGQAPQVQGELSSRGEQILKALSALLSAAEKQPLFAIPDFLRPLLGKARPASKTDLLAQALRAENRGDWVRAAELLEAAGERGRAGRLYERAAAEATS